MNYVDRCLAINDGQRCERGQGHEGWHQSTIPWVQWLEPSEKQWMREPLAQVEQVTMARLAPSDVIVVESTGGPLSGSQRQALSAQIRAMWPWQRVLVLDQPVRLKVMRQAEDASETESERVHRRIREVRTVLNNDIEMLAGLGYQPEVSVNDDDGRISLTVLIATLPKPDSTPPDRARNGEHE